MASGCIPAHFHRAANGDSSMHHHTDSRSPVFRQASAGRRMVLGCGSNVVNQVYHVKGKSVLMLLVPNIKQYPSFIKVVPKVGEKGYFRG